MGYTLKSGYLIFLRIVMMNLQNGHDVQQGFVQFIIPAQQWSTSLVSQWSSQDSLPRHHRYIYLQINSGANLQDSPTTKVEIIRNRLLKLVASTLVIIQEVDSHISNPWSHAQPTPLMQYKGAAPRIVSSKISTLCLSRWTQHFCTATQFSSSQFSSSLQQKTIRYLTHGTSAGAAFTTATHLYITYLPLYNILFSTLDLFAMTIHVASFSLPQSLKLL